MRNTKMRNRRRLNEGMSWEDKYEEVLIGLGLYLPVRTDSEIR